MGQFFLSKKRANRGGGPRGVCQKGKIFPGFFSGTLPLAVVLYHILKARIDRARERFFSTVTVTILNDDGDVNLISPLVFTLGMNLPINIGEEIRSTLPQKSQLATSEEIWQQ